MQKLFDEADKIINGERQDQYGRPEDSFDRIARYWSVYLENVNPHDLDALDVAHMMVLFKAARMQGQKPSRDNYVDAAGYLAIAADRLLPAMGVVPVDKALADALEKAGPGGVFIFDSPPPPLKGDKHGVDDRQ